MVEEAVGTSVCCQEKANLAVKNLKKWQIYNEEEKKFGARIFSHMQYSLIDSLIRACNRRCDSVNLINTKIYYIYIYIYVYFKVMSILCLHELWGCWGVEIKGYDGKWRKEQVGEIMRK